MSPSRNARGAALAVGILLFGGAMAQTPPPDTGGVRIGGRETPEDEAEASRRLKDLLPLWATTARRYETYALRFLCTEAHRTIDYSRSAGEAKKDKETPYGYLLTIEPKTAAYQVIRQSLDEEGRPTGSEKSLDMPCPEPYSWTVLFSPTIASTMRFHYLGREIQNYRLTHVVGFEGSAPRSEGKDIREWSGTVWVEEGTGSLVRVEARPNFQTERILALWRDYQQSFTLPWGKAKSRPHGYMMAVIFDFERDTPAEMHGPSSLLFPSRLDLSDFTWVATNREVLDTRLVLTYDDYRFFRAEAIETLNESSAPKR